MARIKSRKARQRDVDEAPIQVERLRSIAAPIGGEPVEEPDDYEAQYDYRLSDLHNVSYAVLVAGGAALMEAIQSVPNLFEKELPKLFSNGADLLQTMKESLYLTDYTSGKAKQYRSLQSNIKEDDWGELNEVMRGLAPFSKVRANGDSYTLMIPAMANFIEGSKIPGFSIPQMLDAAGICAARFVDNYGATPKIRSLSNALAYLPPAERERMSLKVDDLMRRQIKLIKDRLKGFMENPDALDDMTQQLRLTVPLDFKAIVNSEYLNHELILGDNDFAFDKADLKEMVKGLRYTVEITPPPSAKDRDGSFYFSNSEVEFNMGNKSKFPYVRRVLSPAVTVYVAFTSIDELNTLRNLVPDDLEWDLNPEAEDITGLGLLGQVLLDMPKSAPEKFKRMLDDLGAVALTRAVNTWERAYKTLDGNISKSAPPKPEIPTDPQGAVEFILESASNARIQNWVVNNGVKIPQSLQRVVVDKDDYREAKERLEARAFPARMSGLNDGSDADGAEMVVFAEFDISEEVAQYVTQSHEVDPAELSEWLYLLVDHTYAFSNGSADFYRPVHKAMEDTKTLPQRPRISADRMMIGPDADLVFVPEDNPEFIKRYSEAMAHLHKSALNENEYTRADVGLQNAKVKMTPVEGQESPLISIKNDFTVPASVDMQALVVKKFAAERLHGCYIATDWGADILSYTTLTGGLVTSDISAYAPASVMEYDEALRSKVDVKTSDFIALRNLLTHWMTANGKKLTDYFRAEDFFLPQTVRDLLRGQTLPEYIWGTTSEVSIGEFVGGLMAFAKRMNDYGFNPEDEEAVDFPFEEISTDLRYSELTVESNRTWFRPIGRLISDAMAEGPSAFFNLMGDPAKIGAGNVIGVTSRMQGTAVVYTMAKHNSVDALVELASAVTAKQANYSINPVKVNDDSVIEAVPFLHDEVMALPHQVRPIVSTQRQPDKAVEHVDAGGGKTILNIIDALGTLGKYHARGDLEGKKTKRLMMTCPKSLIKNYLEDIEFLTHGTVNVIVLSTEVINKYGHDYMYNLILNAPINTVVLCDFDFPKNGQYTLQYGSTDLVLSNNAELIRRFEWIYFSMDESQYLANLDSQRSASVRAQATLAENLRQTTGTYVHGQLTDAAGQFSIMSPSTFGSKKDFIEKYAAETFQGKPLSWKPQAEQQVRAEMNNAADYIRVSRREWAALLPEAVETFHKVTLSKGQMACYESILSEALEAIMADAELMKKLKAADENEENVNNIEMLLRPYLQRLEMFIAAPAHDKLGDKLLQGKDRVSPKAGEIINLFKEHMADKSNGKVLIFCAYIAGAEALHAALPEELRNKVILYYAEQKDKLIPQFEKDKNIVGMIGVETSLNTGHNFQFVNRLISIDSVWSPGEFEQGQSRLNRPDPKNKHGKRNRIFFDRIIADGTVDVTKTARMMSKLLTMVRFQAEDSRYDVLPSLPLVSMTLDSITDDNKFGDERDQGSLFAYIDAYAQYTKLRRDEYAEFMKTYDGPTKAKQVPTAGNLPGSALISVPYTANFRLPFPEKLGIMQVSDWLAEKDLLADTADMTGLQVHTEYGDGKVTSSGKATLKVKLKTGETVSVAKLAVFVITHPDKKSIKEKLSDLLGMPFQATQYDAEDIEDEAPEEPVDEEEEPELPTETDVVEDKPKKATVERSTEQDGEVYVYAGVLNNMIQLSLDREDPDVTDDMARRLGFKESGDFFYAVVPTHRAMSNVIDKLTENFTVMPRYLKDLETARDAFTQGKRRLLNFEAALDAEVRSFYLDRKRAVPKGELRPYVLFYEGECWVVVDTTKQPSAVAVKRKVVVPTVKWERADSEWFILANTKAEAKAELDAIARSGVTIANYDEVIADLKDMKLRTKKRTPPAKVNTEVTGKTIRKFATKSGARYVALVKTKAGYSIETESGNTDLGKISEAAAGRALTKAVKAVTKWKLHEVPVE